MALVWRCDRCNQIAGLVESIDDPPDNWRIITVPVRGTHGARSTTDAAICGECDDSLYEWWLNSAS